MNNCAKEVRSALEKRGLTIKEYAAKHNMSLNSFSNLIHGRKSKGMTANVVKIINKELNLSLNPDDLQYPPQEWQTEARISMVKKQLMVKDVSKLTGLSIDTVSQTLNGIFTTYDAISHISELLEIQKPEHFNSDNLIMN